MDPFGIRITADRGTRVELDLNDLPVVYRTWRGSGTTTLGAREFAVPGDNTIRVTVGRRPARGVVEVECYFKGEAAGQLSTVWATRIDDDARAALGERRTATGSFRLPTSVHRRAWFDAPRFDFDCDGLPEQRAAVERFHALLTGGDVDAVLAFGHLSTSEMGRAYADQASQVSLERSIRETLVGGLRVRPIDDVPLHFERRAEGRVAYATRTDGRPVISARTLTRPHQNITRNPLLTFHDGKWSLFG